MKYRWSFIDNIYLIALAWVLYLIIAQSVLRIGLWGDELALANHFFDNYSTFFQPLKSKQVAPLLFLIIEKTMFLVAQFLGYGYDFFLRLYPVLCGIGTVVLYYFAIARLSHSKVLAIFSFLILLTSNEFIYYTSEVKQYICELWCTVLLLYVYSFKNSSVKYTIIFCTTVLYGALSSHVICFALLPMGVYDTYLLTIKYKFNLKKMLVAGDVQQHIIRYVFSLLVLIGYYLLFLYNHPTEDFMIDWWKKSFVTKNNFLWLLRVNLQIIYPYLKLIISNMQIWLNIMAIGLLLLLFLKNKFLFIFSFLMIGTHLLFSYFQLYPVANRLILYWIISTSLFLGSCIYFSIMGIYWAVCCILLILSFVYSPMKRIFCALKKEYRKQYVKTIISVFGCLFIVGCCFKFINYQIPIYMHRAANRKIYMDIQSRLKENDIVVLHNRGVGKYEKLYITDDNFKHISLWDNDKDKYDQINTKLIYDDFIGIPANKIIDYVIYNEELNKYNRIWLTVVDEKKEADKKKPAIENRIREQIKVTGKNKELKECYVVLDTTICLMENGK